MKILNSAWFAAVVSWIVASARPGSGETSNLPRIVSSSSYGHISMKSGPNERLLSGNMETPVIAQWTRRTTALIASSNSRNTAPNKTTAKKSLPACHCDSSGACLDQSMEPDSPLIVCVFSVNTLKIVDIHSLELIHQGYEQVVLAAPGGNQSTANASKVCGSKFCLIETLVDPVIFDRIATSRILTVRGDAIVSPIEQGRKRVMFLRGRKLSVDSVLMGFETSISLVDTSQVSAAEGSTGFQKVIDTFRGLDIQVWLVPLIALVLIASLFICLWMVRRHQRRQTVDGSK